VHPGIVVGQLQHRRRLGYGHVLTRLKARYDITPRPPSAEPDGPLTSPTHAHA
jgi:hypothetical protein